MKKIVNKIIFKISRIIFNYSSSFIFWLPFKNIRKYYLKFFVHSMGKDVYVGRNLDVRNPFMIDIGDDVVINKHVILDGRHGLSIGNHVDIAQEACIWTKHHDYNDPKHSGIGAKTIIEDYCWICHRAILLPGLKVSKGSVVACGAVLTKNTTPLTVVGGIPAKKIAERHNPLTYMLKDLI